MSKIKILQDRDERKKIKIRLSPKPRGDYRGRVISRGKKHD